MLIAQEKWLPQYKDAIEKAKNRPRVAEPRFPDYKGTRVETKSVDEMAKDREKSHNLAAAAEKAGM